MRRIFQATWFLLLASGLSATPSALPATAIINFQSTATAANANAGIFDTSLGGTNYALNDNAIVTGTDGTSNNSTNFNSAAQTFTSAMVGNYLYLSAGTTSQTGRYRITAFVDAHNLTLGATCSTGAMTDGAFKIGGALNSPEDAIFELGVAGNIFYIKSGSYTPAAIIALTAVGGVSIPIKVIGYTTTPGDSCTGTNRPLIDAGINNLNFGANWDCYNVSFKSVSANGALPQGGSKFKNCKFVNLSTTAGRPAVSLSSDAMIIDCEAICHRGIGVTYSTVSGASVINCYIHHCDIGVLSTATSGLSTTNGNIIEGCVTAGVRINGIATSANLIYGNTIFGSLTPTVTGATSSTGVLLATGVTDLRLMNNIISGWVTGIVHPDTQSVGYDNHNDYYGNTTDISATAGGASDTGQVRWQKGPNTVALNPNFAGFSLITGSTASTSTSNRFIQAGATFIGSGVTAGRDFIHVLGAGSGTAVTTGIYGILSVDSETQLTTDILLTSGGASVPWQIGLGHNFAVGVNLKGIGAPGVFQGGLSTSYSDIGAVQRQEAAAGQTSTGGVQ